LPESVPLRVSRGEFAPREERMKLVSLFVKRRVRRMG